MQSTVARAVRPEQYNEKPPLLAGYYTYWSGLPMDGRFEASSAPTAPVPHGTNDGLTLVIAGWQCKEFEANKADIEGNYRKVIELAPGFDAWQPGGDGRIRARHRRCDVARGILLRRERPGHLRGGPLVSGPGASMTGSSPWAEIGRPATVPACGPRTR